MRVLALALLLVASCADKIPDVCATRPGTCIAIDLSGPSDFKFDQLSITADTIMIRDQLTPPGPRVPAVAAPVSFALVPGDGFAGGPFQLTVVARLSGTAIGSGSTVVNVGRGQHIRVGLTIEPFGGGDMGVDLAAPVLFAAATSVPIGGMGPASLAVGDFKKNGKLGIAGTLLFDTVNVLFGMGDGTFTPGGSYAIPGNAGIHYKHTLSAGDFDGDQAVDLVTSTKNGMLFLFNNGDGTFTPGGAGVGDGGAASSLMSLSGVATGDLNFDGKADVAVSSLDGAAVHVFISNGDGTFGGPSPNDFATLGGSGGGTAVAIGDFNADGKADVVSFSGDGNASLLPGSGDGKLGAPTKYGVGVMDQGGASLAVADFDHNGFPDVALAQGKSPSIFVLPGGVGGFGALKTLPLGASVSPFSLVAGDFTGDGNADVAASYADPAGVIVVVFAGKGDGTFSELGRYTIDAAKTVPGAMLAADFTGDGKIDLAVALPNQNQLKLLINVRP